MMIATFLSRHTPPSRPSRPRFARAVLRRFRAVALGVALVGVAMAAAAIAAGTRVKKSHALGRTARRHGRSRGGGELSQVARSGLGRSAGFDADSRRKRQADRSHRRPMPPPESIGFAWPTPTLRPAPRPFIVGTLSEVNEQEPNNRPAEAQRVSNSVVVNGRFGTNGDVDSFAVDLEQGQTLVASLSGHESLGSPMDSVLEIVSARGGVVDFNHDQRGTRSANRVYGASGGPLCGPRLRVSFDSQQHDRVFGRRSICLSADADHENVRRLSLAPGGHAGSYNAADIVRMEHSRVPKSDDASCRRRGR